MKRNCNCMAHKRQYISYANENKKINNPNVARGVNSTGVDVVGD